jgi:hypothetical protein
VFHHLFLSLTRKFSSTHGPRIPARGSKSDNRQGWQQMPLAKASAVRLGRLVACNYRLDNRRRQERQRQQSSDVAIGDRFALRDLCN